MPRICSVEGCGRPHSARGYCSAHVQRVRQYGTPDAERPIVIRRRRAPTPARLCSVADCDNRHFGRGLCAMHWARLQRHGTTDTVMPHRGARGTAHHLWRGDDVSYQAMHTRVRTRLGNARDHRCVDCGGRAQGWSYDHADPDERAGIVAGHVWHFSTKIEHYAPRCKRCHSTFDHAHKRSS